MYSDLSVPVTTSSRELARKSALYGANFMATDDDIVEADKEAQQRKRYNIPVPLQTQWENDFYRHTFFDSDAKEDHRNTKRPRTATS